MLVATAPRLAWADTPAPAPAPATTTPPFRALGDLDGTYLWLGPIGSIALDRDGGDSAFGGVAAVTVVREARRVAVRGVAFTAVRRADADRGQLALEAVAGLGSHLGISLGPMLDVAALAHPAVGATVGVWSMLGPTLTARAGWTGDGWTLTAGLAILLPARRW